MHRIDGTGLHLAEGCSIQKCLAQSGIETQPGPTKSGRRHIKHRSCLTTTLAVYQEDRGGQGTMGHDTRCHEEPYPTTDMSEELVWDIQPEPFLNKGLAIYRSTHEDTMETEALNQEHVMAPVYQSRNNIDTKSTKPKVHKNYGAQAYSRSYWKCNEEMKLVPILEAISNEDGKV